jgi:hypothetical protein
MQGANCFKKNSLGSNCLMLAAEEGYYEIVKMLHEHDLSLKNDATLQLIRGITKHGQTALMLAIEAEVSPEAAEGDSCIGTGTSKAPNTQAMTSRSSLANSKSKQYLDVIQYIIEKDEHWQLTQRNKFDKWYVNRM